MTLRRRARSARRGLREACDRARSLRACDHDRRRPRLEGSIAGPGDDARGDSEGVEGTAEARSDAWGYAQAPRGANTCASCHGNIRPADRSLSRILRNEHTTWVTQDKHSDAYQVLSSKRATAIATALSGDKLPAHEDARCLACHTTPGLDPSTRDEPTLMIRRDGVGCESCHGPSDRWLGAHQQDGWNSLSPSEKEKYGMTPLKELDRRAATCAGCHVVRLPGRTTRCAR